MMGRRKRYPMKVEDMNPTQLAKKDHIRVQVSVVGFFGRTIEQFECSGRPDVIAQTIAWKASRWEKL